MWQLLALVVFCCLAGPSESDPKGKPSGLVCVIDQAALTRYLSTVLLRDGLIQSYLLAIQFQDYPLKEHPEHWLKALHVVKVFVPTISVEFQEDGINYACIKVRIHLSAKFFFGKHFERVDFIIDVGVRAHALFSDFFVGTVNIKIETCKTEFKIARIICSSHMAVNKVRPVIQAALEASLPQKICQTVEVLLNFARIDTLSTTNVLLSMGSIATVQYQLATMPVVTANFFVLELNLILRTGSRFITVPFSTVPLPLPSLNKNVLSLGLSQASLNVLIDVLLQIKVQEFMSTTEVFSGAIDLTDAIAALLSHQKCPKCPGKSPLKITLQVVGLKRILLGPKSAVLKLSVRIAILAKTSTGAFTSLFVLRADLKLNAQASVHDCKLIFATRLISLDLILVSSDVGPIEVTSLVKWIQLLIVETFVPQVNEHLSIGIPLPSVMHISLGYPVVQIIALTWKLSYGNSTSLLERLKCFAGHPSN